jgi:hypothetical protein
VLDKLLDGVDLRLDGPPRNRLVQTAVRKELKPRSRNQFTIVCRDDLLDGRRRGCGMESRRRCRNGG